MGPIFFSSQKEFRKWLSKNHKKEKELIVGFYKVASGKPSMTWSESVDEALCFGWIDGIRKSIDNESYTIRFTPRNPSSNWSTININKVKMLIKKGLMKSAGLKLYEMRQVNKSQVYSYENTLRDLPEIYLKKFKAVHKAWKYFNLQPPSYKKIIIRWILSAKQDSTQLSRLNKVIESSLKEMRLFR